MASITVTFPLPDQVLWARNPSGMLSVTVTGTAKSTKRRTPTLEIESTLVAVKVWLGGGPVESAEITEIDPLNATWSATLLASASANPEVLSAPFRSDWHRRYQQWPMWGLSLYLTQTRSDLVTLDA